MVQILLAEDDKALNELLLSTLKKEGYSVFPAFDGKEAIEIFEREKIDLLVTDVMMPILDGFSLASKVRSLDEKVPILFLTALDDKNSKERGFRLGIDDYVEKPFDMDILLLRIASLLRRANIQMRKELVVGNLRMDEEEHTAYVNGKELNLTVREFDLLYKFLSFPKKTFTRGQLMDEFWGYDSSATSRTVDVYMSKLREKTAECDGFRIVTMHGLGYKAVLS